MGMQTRLKGSANQISHSLRQPNPFRRNKQAAVT